MSAQSPRPYGWSHDVFARGNHADQTATKLAQHFLPLVEQALAAEAVTLKAGVECELSVHGGHNGSWSRHFDEQMKYKRREHTIIKRIGLDGEMMQHNDHTGHDYYINGSPFLIEVKTQPLGLVQAAYAVRNIKREAIRCFERNHAIAMGGKKDQQPPDSPIAQMADDWYGWSLNAEDGFRPSHNGGYTGEHVNLSLWCGTHNLCADEGFQERLRTSLKTLLPADFAMFTGHATQSFTRARTLAGLPSDETRSNRHAENATLDGLFRNKDVDKDRLNPHATQPLHLPEKGDAHARVECRLPDAACNPFLSMLACGLASYACVAEVKGLNNTATIPANLEEAKTQFAKGSNIIPLLHQVIDKVATDADKPALHAKAEQFKQAVLARCDALKQPASYVIPTR